MKPLYIVSAIRTPFTRAGTSLAGMDATDLGKAAVSALLARTGLDPHAVDETIFGCVGQPADAQNIARVIALRAGLPEGKPAMTVHRNCASGLESLTTAHAKMCAGQGEVFIVGGTESMSNMPLYFSRSAMSKFGSVMKARSFGQKMGAMSAFRPMDFAPVIGLKLGLTDPVVDMNMGETAELLAREFKISRERQDAFALRSHQRAAVAAARLQGETAPLYVMGKSVEPVLADNGVRVDTTLEKLSRLKPMFERHHGSVTAGNSSQLTDGAVALLVASEEAVARHGWQPLGKLVDYAYTGCDPRRMGLGPVRAMDALMHRSNHKIGDMDTIEINEAFASQVLTVLECLKDTACARRAGLETALGEIDEERLNPRGGAIALGHPVGATGARLVLTALDQLRETQGRRALVSLCIGGGQGGAALLERV
ncbi:acetyl-CoA C-acetyltransferase/acetyl-CoA acyltransferase [Prosthecobacter fusiformis]|uniref:Acetyl-CoA C-acetyltransferase/acetyl-CoA acyltransferase n=1 Tax=Prosthecobacter fusiformis TaxID=48464 RepID=A0A4R7S0S3_9BACT|nr:thiolase family protein [Prosthecobacter fusiformis]TDU70765.1 acetyl-CoA C-acetyltransferase/acetyl-CoA acyltransferase [Prosthecobacter fusiformis]